MTTSSLMASAISSPSSISSLSSFTTRKLSRTFSNSSISVPYNHNHNHNFTVKLFKLIPHSSLAPFSSWNGLKNLNISTSQCPVRIGSSRKIKRKGVYASLFGVGAPEALVIGVVALLVFGPKGLAEVARNLGQTLRTFQPTIRELQEVSKEFKSTLEREIGLDDIKGSNLDSNNISTTKTSISPSPDTSSKDSQQEILPSAPPSEADLEKQMRIAAAEKLAETEMASTTESQSESQVQSLDDSPSSSRAYSAEEYLKITEEQLKAVAAQQQNETSPEQSLPNTQSQSQDTLVEAPSVIPSPQKPESEM